MKKNTDLIFLSSSFYYFFKDLLAEHPWLTPVISATVEAEIRRIKARQANSLQDPISKIPITKKGWWSGSRCKS
jgi:hypothetical protein